MMRYLRVHLHRMESSLQRSGRRGARSSLHESIRPVIGAEFMLSRCGGTLNHTPNSSGDRNDRKGGAPRAQ
jgi:hypothetical protein